MSIFPRCTPQSAPSKCFPQPLGSAKKRRHIIKLFGWVAPTEGTAATQDKTSQGTAVTQDIRLQVEKYYRLSHGDCAPTRNETPTPLLGLSHPIGLGVPRSFSATTSNVVLDPSRHEGRGRETHAHHDNRDGVQKRVEREEGQRHMHTTTKNRLYMSETRALHVRDT